MIVSQLSLAVTAADFLVLALVQAAVHWQNQFNVAIQMRVGTTSLMLLPAITMAAAAAVVVVVRVAV